MRSMSLPIHGVFNIFKRLKLESVQNQEDQSNQLQQLRLLLMQSLKHLELVQAQKGKVQARLQLLLVGAMVEKAKDEIEEILTGFRRG